MTTGHHERGADGPPVGGRRVELLGLLGLSKRLLAATDPSAAAQALLESVVGLYGFPRAVLLSARGDRLTVVAGRVRRINQDTDGVSVDWRPRRGPCPFARSSPAEHRIWCCCWSPSSGG